MEKQIRARCTLVHEEDPSNSGEEKKEKIKEEFWIGAT
jgi:hypothetical protein